MLGSSDTSVAVLSALPIVADPHPMSIEKMEEARRLADALCGDGRVLLQGEAFPQVGELAETLDRMAELAAAHRLVAWKTYTHIGGGYASPTRSARPSWARCRPWPPRASARPWCACTRASAPTRPTSGRPPPPIPS